MSHDSVDYNNYKQFFLKQTETILIADIHYTHLDIINKTYSEVLTDLYIISNESKPTSITKLNIDRVT